MLGLRLGGPKLCKPIWAIGRSIRRRAMPHLPLAGSKTSGGGRRGAGHPITASFALRLWQRLGESVDIDKAPTAPMPIDFLLSFYRRAYGMEREAAVKLMRALVDA